MGHCAILGLVELCYLSERTYPVMALEYHPTVADYWKHRQVLVILTTGPLRTRRLVRHHQTEARALTPNMSTRNRGSKSIFKALYAMYHESLSSGVGGVVLSRHQYVLLFKSGPFFTPSLLPSLPNSVPRPNLNNTSTKSQSHIPFPWQQSLPEQIHNFGLFPFPTHSPRPMRFQ